MLYEIRAPALLAAALLLLIAPTSGLDAATMKLSGAIQPSGDVRQHQVSADGRWVVFTADLVTADSVELYSVPLAGGEPVRLSSLLPSGSAVFRFFISPDSKRVIYLAPQEDGGECYASFLDPDPGTCELYSVPIGGPATAIVKLNPTLVAGGEVGPSPQISSDGSRVVYIAEQETDFVAELYSVPIAGPATAGVKLNRPIPIANNSMESWISPDGSRVLYATVQDDPAAYELYSVPMTGPAEAGVTLSGPLVTGGVVESVRVSPDGSRAVYVADQEINDRFELYSVPITGPASSGVKLNPTLVAGRDVVASSVTISPDGSRVVYVADQETDHLYELYSVPITGPANDGLKLSPTLDPGFAVHRSLLRISPDSSRVVYRVENGAGSVYALHSVPIAGPASADAMLSPEIVAEPNTFDRFSFEISPDSGRVVYQADQDQATLAVHELYSVPIAGPATAGVRLNAPMVEAGGTSLDGADFQISRDGRRVIYRTDQQTDEVFELYSVPIEGPSFAVTKLNPPLVSGGDVARDRFGFEIAADGSRVAYRADQESQGVVELFVADQGTTEVAFPAPTLEVTETAGTVALVVELSDARVVPVTVDYAVTGGTASGSGVDYALTDGTLSFDIGATSETVPLVLTDDGAGDSAETIELSLSSPANGSIGPIDVLTVTILEQAPARIFADGFESGDLSAWSPVP